MYKMLVIAATFSPSRDLCLVSSAKCKVGRIEVEDNDVNVISTWGMKREVH